MGAPARTPRMAVKGAARRLLLLAGLLAGLAAPEEHREFVHAVAVESEKLVYGGVAKAACAENKRFVRWLAGKENWEKTIHSTHAMDLTVMSMEPIELGRKLVESEDWTQYVVLRDSADRLLSAFLNKCRPQDERSDKVAEQRKCLNWTVVPSVASGKRTVAQEMAQVVEKWRTDGPVALFPEWTKNMARGSPGMVAESTFTGSLTIASAVWTSMGSITSQFAFMSWLTT